MAKYNKVLYDYIGREYDRKNLYLKEVATLEENIQNAGPGEKETLRNQLKELISKKNTHPYILKLKDFENERKSFFEEQKLSGETFAKKLDASLSPEVARLENRLYKSKMASDFFKDYVDLSYDAEFAFKEAEIDMKLLPDIIENIKRLEKELKTAENMSTETSDSAKIHQEIEQFKTEQKLKLDTKIENLKKKKNEGLISEKALKYGIEEYKKDYKYAVNVKSFLDPVKNKKEYIKSKKYELKSYIKVNKRVVNADIADSRRNVPSEVMKTTPFVSYLTVLVPGLGQLLNKQYIKAVLFALSLIFIYVIAIPYALGYGNYQGKGIAGLVSLAEGGKRIDKSLIFMIEGIIAIFLLIFAVFAYILSYKDVSSVEKGVIRGVRPKNWFETKTSIEEDGFPYLVSFPALIVIVFIVLVPIATAILLSFTGMDPKNQSKFPWVGISNYKLIALGEGLAGSVFWQIFGWTVLWTLLSTTLAIFIGFGLALLANNPRIKGKAFFRTVFLLPWAVPGFISIMFFSIMFSKTGAITVIIQNLFGIFIDFKNDTNWTRAILIFLQGWLGSSYIFLLSTGVLQAIPEDLYEAADIDGANTWQRIRRITLPMVLFQTAPLLVNQYTFNFNNFSIIYLFNNGGPFNPTKYGNLAGSSDILISYIYKLTMDNQYQSIGAAITIVISFGLMIFTFLGYRNSKAFKEERL